jgi:hypothetical protein
MWLTPGAGATGGGVLVGVATERSSRTSSPAESCIIEEEELVEE